MSLTRFLPTPSDRMGILWSLLTIDDTVVLEYGPAGTTHFSVGLWGELGANRQNHLFTTHMGEENVIMGDVERLEKAIVEIDRNLSPKVIFVVASSVAAVIGSDIKGVCSYMQEKVNAKLVAFEQGGFRGDYSTGLGEVYNLLVKELVNTELTEKQDTVNLIGFSLGSYRALSDYKELEDLLERGFHLKIGACLCGETSLQSIEQMGTASLNLVLREEGIEAAKYLSRRFATPTVAGAPYGYKGTLEWLEKIEKALGRPLDPTVRAELEERVAESGEYWMMSKMMREDIPSAVLAGEYRTILGIGDFLEELGITVSHRICLHSLKKVPNPDAKVEIFRTEKERVDLMKGLYRKFILADDPSMSVCPADNIFLRISMPVVRGAQKARHLPLMGIRGADFILESVEEYLQMLH